jgi:tRNA(Arg) A34 adenosine deaminase TadA
MRAACEYLEQNAHAACLQRSVRNTVCSMRASDERAIRSQHAKLISVRYMQAAPHQWVHAACKHVATLRACTMCMQTMSVHNLQAARTGKATYSATI